MATRKAVKTKKTVDGTVTATTNLGITILNDVGGTTGLGQGVYRVRLIERGRRYSKGILLDPTAVETARAKGITGFTPEHYATRCPNNPRLAEDARIARDNFDPSVVYFGSDSFKAN